MFQILPLKEKDVGGGTLTPFLARTRLFAAGDGGKGEGGGEGQGGGEGGQGEGRREGGGCLAGKVLFLCFILYFLFCANTQQKDTKVKFSFFSSSTKNEKKWEFWRSKGNTELLLLSPSANSAQTENAWAGEIKEREIEK